MPERPQPIKGLRHPLRYVAAIATVVAVVAAHGAIIPLVAAHAQLSLAVVLALGGLVAIMHLGLLGSAYGALRRYFHRNR